jgi:hypothetical protein
VADRGTVIGCCLLEIADIRPAGLPAAVGINLRAAAHRLSVEWDDEAGRTIVGVYVPVRLTDSRLAVTVGGRLFPGVHRPAMIQVLDEPDRFTWRVDAPDARDPFGIRVAVGLPSASPVASPDDAVGQTCLAAAVGLSPDHHGIVEAVRMEPDHHLARAVEITDLRSDFVSSFATAVPAPAYLMENVKVRWTPAPGPVGAAVCRVV